MPNARFGSAVVRVQGLAELAFLLNAPLVQADAEGRIPILAQVVPTLENGLLKTFPDGTMETTWKIREDTVWHDGTPFTAEDILFTNQVDMDRELPLRRDPTWDLVTGVDAPDAHTIVIRWREPFITADTFVAIEPLPRHLLQATYANNKEKFATLPFWTDGFVGTGAFRLDEFAVGQYARMTAFDRYVLGRPKIDEIQVRFIADPNALAANILAGAIDTTIGIAFDVEQATNVSRQWPEGRLIIFPISNELVIHPQLTDPSPAIIADVRFRRALLHAIDRQEMADTIQGKNQAVAHLAVGPNDQEFRFVESAPLRYDYDLRKAIELIEELGYVRGADGFFQDAANRRLAVELRVITIVRIAERAMPAVADYWQRIGVSTDIVPVSPQLGADREWRSTRSGFEMMRYTTGSATVGQYRSDNIPLPANRFIGTNNSRYVSAEFDALWNRYVTTIPWDDRMGVLRQLVRHMTDNMVTLPIFYDKGATLVHSKLVGVLGGSRVYNVHEWDVQ